MTTVTPTYSAVQWGPLPHQLFDYYANPTRITGGNPLLILRHSSWSSNNYQAYRDSSNTNLFYFYRWLLANQGSQESAAHAASSPAECWDVCCVETGQQKHGNTVTPRSIAMYAMDAVRDYQAAICAIRGAYRTYSFNPDRVVVGGESAGAAMGAISQLAPPRLGGGGGGTYIDSIYSANSFSSVCRGIFNCEGPVDIRNSNNDNPPTGTDYFHYSRIGPWTGTSIVSATEWNAIPARVKDALSMLAYFERGDLANYSNMLAIYARRGNGVKPLGNAGVSGSDPHDSIQLTDLARAAVTASMPLTARLIDASDYTNDLYPSAPSTAWLKTWRPAADALAGMVN